MLGYDLVTVERLGMQRVATKVANTGHWCRLQTWFAVVLATALGFALFASASHAALTTEDVIVEVQPSSADAALWTLARQTIATVDAEMLEDDSAEGLASLQKAYRALHQTLAEADRHRSFFKLEDIPVSLGEAFEQGTLPQSALFSAAASVATITEAEAAGLDLPRLVATQSMADNTEVMEQVEAFKAALEELDDTDRLLVSGNTAGFEKLPDDQLKSVASRPGTAGEAAQLELDRRLAANFPDMSGYSNGLLPDDLLCPIPWDTRYQLHCSTMDNFIRLGAAYQQEFGTNLPILSGYRPLADQYAVNADSPNMTAIPGTSNHGWGLAVDFDWDVFDSWDAPEVKWMIENGPRFGWRHPSALNWNTDRPEPWHFEFGTMYGGTDAQDFDGPTPEVIYRVKSFG